MFVSRFAVSLRIPGLEKKALVKIKSLVYKSQVIEGTNWFACCSTFELFSGSGPNRPSMFFEYLSVCVSFLYTLTCLRPRTLFVMVFKKESPLSTSLSLVNNVSPFGHPTQVSL